MSFETCKQIEINGKVFDVWKHYKTGDGMLSISDKGFEHTFTHSMLEAIGAKPVVDVPKKGEPVWYAGGGDFIPYISTGKMEGEYLIVYGLKDPLTGEIKYGKVDNWKPFNPEELE